MILNRRQHWADSQKPVDKTLPFEQEIKWTKSWLYQQEYNWELQKAGKPGEASAQQQKYIYIHIQIFIEDVLHEKYFVCFLKESNIFTGTGDRDTNKSNFSEFLRLIFYSFSSGVVYTMHSKNL